MWLTGHCCSVFYSLTLKQSYKKICGLSLKQKHKRKPTMQICFVFCCRIWPKWKRYVDKHTLTCKTISLSVLKLGRRWLIKRHRGRCKVFLKLGFLIRGGIPEPQQSHHQTVLPLWQPNGGMRFSRRYEGTYRLLGGKVHQARRWGEGGLKRRWRMGYLLKVCKEKASICAHDSLFSTKGSSDTKTRSSSELLEF